MSACLTIPMVVSRCVVAVMMSRRFNELTGNGLGRDRGGTGRQTKSSVHGQTAEKTQLACSTPVDELRNNSTPVQQDALREPEQGSKQ